MPGDYRILDHGLDLQEAVRSVAGPDRGAIATFVGTARDHHRGRKVVRLEYEAYGPMAEKIFCDIGREVQERFGTPHIAILHRIGEVAIGEASVIIAVAAAHRSEALAACAYAIERLKAIAPIWKKEHDERGASWIEGPSTDRPAS
jgi:molybdopterin synthase catalytic subunit